MGSEAASDDGETGDLKIGMPGLDAAAEGVAARHGLPPSPELERLIDTLFGISCRDQELPRINNISMADRRREGYELACRIRHTATSMLSALESLHADVGRFHEVVESNPTLLEAIFELDTGGPGRLWLPPEIAVLYSLFPNGPDDAEGITNDPLPERADGAEGCGRPLVDPPSAPLLDATIWQAVDDALAAVARIPIRSRISTGSVPNNALRDAVERIRNYWIACSGQQWRMSSLRNRETRAEGKYHTLAGECERFVVDALGTAGISFDYKQLASAWFAVDKAATNVTATGI